MDYEKTTSAGDFLDSLHFDQNGNILAKLTDVNGNELLSNTADMPKGKYRSVTGHQRQLCRHHTQNSDKYRRKYCLSVLRAVILLCMVSNGSQKKDLSLEKGLEIMKSLFQLFCTDNYQTVYGYMNQKETEIEPDLWDLLKLVHKKAIHCSVISSYVNHLLKG